MAEPTFPQQDHRNRLNRKRFNPEYIEFNHKLRKFFLILTLSFFVFAGNEGYAGIIVDCNLAIIPEVRNEESAQSWWMTRHEDKLQEENRETAELLFLGDSITQGWEAAGSDVWDEYYAPLGAYNLGYSGDRTENVLWRLQNGEVEGINPKLTVVMIGTNNTGHRQDPPECTARGIELILEELKERLPETRILLLAIFPRGETSNDPLRQLNKQINDRISELADNRRISFLDINDVFLNEEGRLPDEVMPDKLHPNEHGYSLWAEAMDSTLRRMLAE